MLYLQHFLAHNVLLAQLLVGMLVIAAATIVLMVGLRPERDHVNARHRGRRRSWQLRHQPRHGVRPAYTPRHEDATAAGYNVAIDTAGDITVVHARHLDLGDEPTNATLEALLRHPVGAAA